jgi:hypothetical protein
MPGLNDCMRGAWPPSHGLPARPMTSTSSAPPRPACRPSPPACATSTRRSARTWAATYRATATWRRWARRGRRAAGGVVVSTSLGSSVGLRCVVLAQPSGWHVSFPAPGGGPAIRSGSAYVCGMCPRQLRHATVLSSAACARRPLHSLRHGALEHRPQLRAGLFVFTYAVGAAGRAAAERGAHCACAPGRLARQEGGDAVRQQPPQWPVFAMPRRAQAAPPQFLPWTTLLSVLRQLPEPQCF